MRPSALVLLLLAACDSGLLLDVGAPAPGRAPAVVRVATWNVHDLFDAEDRLVPPGDLDVVPSTWEVDAKLEAVAAVLARLDADVVLLQEVENLPILSRLAAAAGYGEARLVEGRDPRGIDVAVLSRLPMRAYVSHAAELGPDGLPLWPRDCVEAHVLAGRGALVVVGSHLSSALSDGGTRRAWQAARLRAIADGLRSADPRAVLLAGGDLNDAPGSPALAPLLADGAWIDPVPAGATTWTDGGRASRLDYLLLPRGGPGTLLAADVLAGPDVAAASDHRPVVLDLVVE